MTKPANPTIDVLLDVNRVGHGGNTGGGQYFYSFWPEIANTDTTDTTLVYALSDDTPRHFRIRYFFSSDALDQLSAPKISHDGRRVEVVNKNTRAYLIQVSLQVEDTRNGRLVNCDPQVTNIPEI